MQMKKIISLIAAVLLTVLLCSSLTLAESGAGEEAPQQTQPAAEQTPEPIQYESTKRYIEMLTDHELEYTCMDIDENGYERIAVKLTDEESGLSYELRFYFHQSEASVSIRVWDFIMYEEAKTADVLAACNAANREWKYVTFVAEEDNTVTIEMDQITTADNVEDICWKAMLYIGNAVAGTYETYFDTLAAKSGEL